MERVNLRASIIFRIFFFAGLVKREKKKLSGRRDWWTLYRGQRRVQSIQSSSDCNWDALQVRAKPKIASFPLLSPIFHSVENKWSRNQERLGLRLSRLKQRNPFYRIPIPTRQVYRIGSKEEYWILLKYALGSYWYLFVVLNRPDQTNGNAGELSIFH